MGHRNPCCCLRHGRSLVCSTLIVILIGLFDLFFFCHFLWHGPIHLHRIIRNSFSIERIKLLKFWWRLFGSFETTATTTTTIMIQNKDGSVNDWIIVETCFRIIIIFRIVYKYTRAWQHDIFNTSYFSESPFKPHAERTGDQKAENHLRPTTCVADLI